MKVLFVTHDISLYGAAKSLALLLKSISKKVDCHLLINRRLIGKNDLNGVSQRFGIPVENIYEAHLPFMHCEIGKPKKNIYWFVKQALWKFNKGRLTTILSRLDFDIIHLNSIVLYPLINKTKPFVIHIREIFDNSSKEIFKYLSDASSIIFIDSATQKPFQEIDKLQIVLDNPFDQRDLLDYKTTPPIIKIDYKEKIIYSIIGVIKPTKGQLFVIESFNQIDSDNSLLVIVGKSTDNDYLEKCKKAAHGNSNIIFWGEEDDINKIYYMSDYIIRSEAYPCVGRTALEGLYSDCKIILQGKPENYNSAITDFKNSIDFYTPRDGLELISILKTTSKAEKRTKTNFLSNITSYGSLINDFFKKTYNEHNS